MQRLIVLIVFLLGYFIYINAQDVNDQDIIRLKSGKIVRGIILKNELGIVTMKVTDSVTQESKLLQIQRFEISKINKATGSSVMKTDSISDYKEGNGVMKNTQQQPDRNILKESNYGSLIPQKTEQTLQSVPQPESHIPLPSFPESTSLSPGQTVGVEDNFDPFSVPRPKRQPKLWNRDIRGFRGFIDYSYIQGFGDAKNHRLEWATSLGFQFNPIFYTGIGTAYDLTLNDKDGALPVFINSHINFLDENTTPYWDVRVGYSVAAGKGLYLSTGFGVSFTKKGKRAFNLGIIYSLQKTEFYEWSDKEPPTRIKVKDTYHGLALRLSFEFGIGR